MKAPDEVRVWQIVGNLPDATPGQWLDTVEAFAHESLVVHGAAVEFALHAPVGKPPHVRLLVASREIGRTTFGRHRPDWYAAIVDVLRPKWLEWLAQES
jgi:hypothetical protein